MLYYQQGDVLIKPLSDRPHLQRAIEQTDTRIEEVDELVAREGESGNTHRIKGKIKKYIPKYGSEIIFTLTEEATIYHEEHGPITIPPGDYYIDAVREFDPIENTTRRVYD